MPLFSIAFPYVAFTNCNFCFSILINIDKREKQWESTVSIYSPKSRHFVVYVPLLVHLRKIPEKINQ